MGKLKIKKADVWIDMTPMSDVMVLLLTFFMLTSTFVKQEPVKVMTPKSISQLDVPEQNLLTIHVDSVGHVYMSTTDQVAQEKALQAMLALHSGTKLNNEQIQKFKIDPMWGTPMNQLEAYLKSDDATAELKKLGGIKLSGETFEDSISHKVAQKSEFQEWVGAVKDAYKEISDASSMTDEEKAKRKFKIAIKAEAKSDYAKIKDVLNQLQDIHETRYCLITDLKKSMED